MPNIVAIAGGELAIELALAGIPVREVEDAGAAEQTLRDLLETDARIIVVQEDLMKGFSGGFRKEIVERRGLPLVGTCPSFGEERPDLDAVVSEFVRPAVGRDIRLE